MPEIFSGPAALPVGGENMDLREFPCFGVAGNFAGHLEQAGEAADFRNVVTAEPSAPKALFPIYIPGREDSFLAEFPISGDTIRFPENADNLQIEPEIAVLFRVNYAGDQVLTLAAECFGAFNDCSIRRPGARKISEKKNWGPCSKGFSQITVPVDVFAPGGILDSYRIASFLIRDGVCHAYGVDSAARNYSYMYGKLVEWITDRMNSQKDQGPAEDIHSMLLDLERPTTCLVTIGATRYTEFGQANYLRRGDVSVVVVYSEKEYSPAQIAAAAESGRLDELGCPVLRQQVI